MNRKTKNTIMAIILLIMFGAMVFTIYYVKNHILLNDSSLKNGMPSMNQNEQMGIPLEMPNGGFNQGNNQLEIP